MRPSEGRFHHEQIGVARLARLGGKTGTQLEVAGVEQALTVGFNERHGAAEDVAGREKREVKSCFRAGAGVGDPGCNADAVYCCPAVKVSPFTEGKEVFQPFPAQSRAHESGGSFSEHHFTMRGNVVAVRVADENPLRASLRFVSVEPQAELRQMHANAVKAKLKRGHGARLRRTGLEDKGCPVPRRASRLPCPAAAWRLDSCCDCGRRRGSRLTPARPATRVGVNWGAQLGVPCPALTSRSAAGSRNRQSTAGWSWSASPARWWPR